MGRHSFFGDTSVAAPQHINELTMLAGDIRRVAVVGGVSKEVRTDPGLDRAPDLQAMLLAREDDNGFVEADVIVGDLAQVSACCGILHGVDDPREVPEIVFAHPVHGFAEGELLQSDADRDQDVFDLFLTDPENLRPSIRVGDDESLLLELAQRLAYRGSAGAQLVRDVELHELVTGGEFARSYGLPKNARHAFAARTGGKGAKRQRWHPPIIDVVYCRHSTKKK